MKSIFSFLYLALTHLAYTQENINYSASMIAMWGSDTACIETFTIAGNQLFGLSPLRKSLETLYSVCSGRKPRHGWR